MSESETITVYEKPTCTTCREADKIFRESGVDYEKINYFVENLSEKKLHELLKKMGIPARELLRKSEATYREMGLSHAQLTEKELVALMIKHPQLIQRPIIECGSKAILGRPVEKIREFLESL